MVSEFAKRHRAVEVQLTLDGHGAFIELLIERFEKHAKAGDPLAGSVL